MNLKVYIMLLLVVPKTWIIPRCDEPYLDQRISSKVALNEKVIGLLASDKKSGVLSSIGPPTSFFIPTIGYIYSEDAFLKKVIYKISLD